MHNKITEKDIEYWLWESPELLCPNSHIHWLARQYIVPSGVIDLLGMDGDNNFVIVEVKNILIDAKALAQVKRYTNDIDTIASYIARDYEHTDLDWRTFVHRTWSMVVGTAIKHIRIVYEAEAADISLFTFDELRGEITGPWFFSDGKRNQDNKVYAALAQDPLFSTYRDWVKNKSDVLWDAWQERDK